MASERPAEAHSIEASPSSFLDATVDGVLVHDFDGRIHRYNTSLVETLGLPEDLVAAGRLAPVRQHLRERLTNPEGYDRGVERDGQRPGAATSQVLHLRGGTVMERHSRPWREDGKLLGRVVTFRDVTEHHRTREHLRASRELHRQLFDRNVAGTFRTSLDGEILDCNPAFAEMLGYDSTEELIGRSALELYASPDDRPEWTERLRETGHLAGVELKLVRRDGSTLWVLENSFLTEDSETGEPVNMGTLVDITDRKHMEEELRRSERRYRLLFEESPVGIAVVGPEGRPLRVNETLTEILGYAAEELKSMSFEEFTHPEDVEKDLELYRELVAGEREDYRIEKRYLKPDGSVVWAELYVTRVSRERGSDEGERAATTEDPRSVAFVRDRTDQQAYEERLRHQAYHDTLTGLPNRRLLEAQAERALREADRHGDRAALLFVDLRRFKRVNDSFGHETGDQVLAQVARRIAGCTRGADVCARVGGDEFALLLTKVEDASDAREAARRLDEGFEQPFRADEQAVHLQARIGIALYPDHASNFSQLLSHADQAMFETDPAAGQRVALYRPLVQEGAADEVSREEALRRALAEEELRLDYQPIYRVGTEAMAGAEGLARWSRPGGEALRAAQFVPLAERTGLARELDRYVLASAVRQLARWPEDGPVPGWISVNLSAGTFGDPGLTRHLRSLLEAEGVPGRRLVIEVTERVAMRDPEAVAGTLRELQELGVGVAIDDYGTGHAVLAYLKHFEAQFLKLDMVFVQRLGEDPRDENLLEGIVTLGHELEMEVIAEGVETAAQMAALGRIGADLAQGYHLGRPAPAEELF